VTLGPHAGFIVASYAMTLAVIAMLIAWVALGYREQKRQLAELEARGATRRSGTDPGKPS
jgi:heme exporter protein D